MYFVLQLDLRIWKNHPSGIDFEDTKWSCRAAEALHCEKPGKAIGEGTASVAVKLSVKPSCNGRPQYIGDASVMNDYQELQPQWSGVIQSLESYKKVRLEK